MRCLGSRAGRACFLPVRLANNKWLVVLASGAVNSDRPGCPAEHRTRGSFREYGNVHW